MARVSHKEQTNFQLLKTIEGYKRQQKTLEKEWGFIGTHSDLFKRLPESVQSRYRHLSSMLKNAEQESADRETILKHYTNPKEVAKMRNKLKARFNHLLMSAPDMDTLRKLMTDARIFIQNHNI